MTARFAVGEAVGDRDPMADERADNASLFPHGRQARASRSVYTCVEELWEYLDQVNAALLFIDPRRSEVIHANKSARQRLGALHSKSRQRSALQLFAREERVRGREALERSAEGEVAILEETQLLARAADGQGEPEPFHARVEMSRFELGGELIVQLRFVDLSEKKRLEHQNRSVEEFLENLVESSHIGIVTYNLDGAPLSWNAEAENIFGYKRDEIIERSDWPGGAKFLVCGSNPEAERARIEAAMSACQTKRLSSPVPSLRRRKDGRILSIESIFSPIRSGKGDVIAVAEYARDLTEQTALEGEARFLRELNRVILENIRQGLAVLDLRGHILYLNPALLRMGRLGAGALHLRLDQLEPQSELTRVFQEQIDALRSAAHPRPSAPKEIELAGAGRNSLRLRCQSVPLLDDARQERFLLAIVEDVTEARALEMQLIQSEKLAAMGQLAAGVAHEIRSPLGTIYNALYDLGELVDMENDEIREDIEVARDEVERVQDIITNLLDFARSGRHGAKQRLDLNDLVRRAIKLIAKEFRNYGVEIAEELCDGEAWLWFSGNAMKQILLNLLANAMQAMPQGGVVAIRTKLDAPRPGFLSLEIADTGTGIPPRVLKNIFDPFFTTKEPGRGTGLGLSVVHTAVKDHDGEIEVETEEGKGTTFRLILPCDAPADEVG